MYHFWGFRFSPCHCRQPPPPTPPPRGPRGKGVPSTFQRVVALLRSFLGPSLQSGAPAGTWGCLRCPWRPPWRPLVPPLSSSSKAVAAASRYSLALAAPSSQSRPSRIASFPPPVETPPSISCLSYSGWGNGKGRGGCAAPATRAARLLGALLTQRIRCLPLALQGRVRCLPRYSAWMPSLSYAAASSSADAARVARGRRRTTRRSWYYCTTIII